MSHGAVCTLLRRLEEKSQVSRKKGAVGKAFVYRARVRPGRTYRDKVSDLLQRVFGGSSTQLLSSLFETQPPDEKELRHLQQMLDDLRKGRGKGGTR
jgi:predicted transcriptional regulator